jgi:hypothetical protein
MGAPFIAALPEGYVRSLVVSVSPTGTGVVALFSVYLDDSGSQDVRNAFAVGGYLGYDKQWDEAQRNWDEILTAFNRRHGCSVRYFHMTDLVSGHEDFKGLSEDVRVALMESLISLIRCRALTGVGSSMRTEHYIEVIGPPADKGRVDPPPLSLCFQRASLLTKAWAHKHNKLDQPFVFVIEKGSKYRGELMNGFELVSASLPFGSLYALDSIAQGPKQLAGLQMADLYAWSLGAERKGILLKRGRLSDSFRLPLDRFLTTFPHAHYPWDLEHLKEISDLVSAWDSKQNEKQITDGI